MRLMSIVLNNTITNNINSFPGVRGFVRSASAFFVNFGDLFLFFYH